MDILVPREWKNYELIDVGDHEKLERWGDYILRRPEPQAVWPRRLGMHEWNKCHGHYHRSVSGGGKWQFKTFLPKKWIISSGNLSFYIEPFAFKHTGLFPEQLVNWNWLMNKCLAKKIKVLNLFAYTGAATVAMASVGAQVCHVDASKGMVQRAKENLALSGYASENIRFIVDDVIKFVKREQRRNNTYDAIIMDPPSFGRGPKGEVWKLEESLYQLVKDCASIMSSKPTFFLINLYTTGLSSIIIDNILRETIQTKYGGKISCGEIALEATCSKLLLSCGIFGRWEF